MHMPTYGRLPSGILVTRILCTIGAYRVILQLNIVLDRIDAAQGSAQQKNRVRAQARINRGMVLHALANLYGSDYQVTTATMDLAVPLVLLPNANQRPARATVQQVYAQILQDLNAAVAGPDLPGMGQDIYTPERQPVSHCWQKMYLYMARYQDRLLSAADSALTINNKLWDYNTSYVMPGSLIDLSKGTRNTALQGYVWTIHFTVKYYKLTSD